MNWRFLLVTLACLTAVTLLTLWWAQGSFWQVDPDAKHTDSRSLHEAVSDHREHARISTMPFQQCATLYGRVIDAARGRPVSDVDVTCSLANPPHSLELHALSDMEGRFSLDLPIEASPRLALTLVGPGNIGHLRTEVRTGDAGDIVLPLTRLVSFLVSEAEGDPLEGVFAGAGRASARSNQHGRGDILVTEEQRTATFALLGYQIREVDLSDVVAYPLAVVLENGNTLEITVEFESDPRDETYLIELRCLEPCFLGGRMFGDPIFQRIGASPQTPALSQGPDGIGAQFRPDRNGRVVVTGLRSDIPINVVLVDWYGAVLARKRLSIEEHGLTTVILKSSRPSRNLRGRITDKDGNSLSNAKVSILLSQDVRVSTRSNKAGFFEFSGLHFDSVCILVDKEGYAPTWNRRVVLGDGENEIKFCLDRGSRLVVRVETMEGSPVPTSRVSATSLGFVTRWASKHETNVFVLEHVSTKESTSIRAVVGGRIYSVTAYPYNSECSIRVPRHGSLIVLLSSSASRDCTAVLRSTTPGKNDPMQVHGDAREGNLVVFPAVLPGTYTLSIESNNAGERRPSTEISRPIVIRAGQNKHVQM